MAQLNFNDLKRQIEDAGLSASAFEAEFRKINAAGGDVTKLLTTMQATLDGINNTSQGIVDSFTDLSAQLKANLAELGKTNSALSISKKSYQGITSVVDKLKNEEQGIYDFNVKQLKALQEKARVGYDDLRRSVEQLNTEEMATEAGQAMLRAKESGYEIELKALKAIEQRLALEKKVEKTFGATGALIEGSSKLLSTMGFGHLSSELSELNDKLKSDLRDELQKSGDGANKLALSFEYMGKGLAGSAKIFAEGLADPLFIVGKILDTYLEINKASVDLQRLTGQNAVAAASWNTSYASAKDILETMSELTLRTGMNAQNIFSGKVLSQAAELKTTMGLTAEEAGGIAIMAQTSGKSVDDITESVVATTSAFNSANRSAVSQGQVLRDVANTADSIKLSLGNNDEAITKAASAARRLGMDLARVDEIAGSLMNFEDSIGKELEAELLTGKQLNLEKARELALTNDLEGLSKELFKNSSDIAEFGKMNRIQQESYAAALGMSRDELAKMAYNKAIEAGMTEEQAAAAAKVNAEDMKRVAAQENFAKALEKIAGALAPILDVVGSILNLPLAPYLILAAVAATKLGFSVSGVGKAFGSMFSMGKQALTGLMGLFKKGGLTSALGGLKDKLVGGFGEGTGDMVRSKSGKLFSKDSPQGKMISNLSGKTSEAADAAKKIPEKTGGGMSNLTDSIQKIKPAQLIAGAAALLIAAAAMFVLGKAMQEFQGIGVDTYLGAGAALLGLSLALAGLSLIGPAVLVGAAALLVGAAAIYVLGKALQEVGKALPIMAEGIGLIFPMLIGLSQALGPLILLGPALFGIAAGLGAISLAGLAALPAIGGLMLLSKAAPALVSLGIGAGEKTAGAAKGKGEESQLEKKIGELITVLNREQTININIDGGKVATATIKHGPLVKSGQS